MLRQSPNIIMIGEIRDAETAEIAVNAALTGHLVISTLHTRDAPGAVTRLLDLGAKPFLVSTVLRAVVAQRLVRRHCGRCAGTGRAGEGACPGCNGARFHGRLGLYELLIVDDEVACQLAAGIREARLREIMRARGRHSLHEDGMAKVRAGLTALEEVMAVAPGETNGM